MIGKVIIFTITFYIWFLFVKSLSYEKEKLHQYQSAEKFIGKQLVDLLQPNESLGEKIPQNTSLMLT